LAAILEKRTQEELRKTLTGWGKEVLEQIEEVSPELWLTYKNLVKELMPSAEVVADRFHVMKQINQELDQQRRDVRRCSDVRRDFGVSSVERSVEPSIRRKKSRRSAEKLKTESGKRSKARSFKAK